MTIRVRPATDADLAAVRFIGFATWPSTYGAACGADFVVDGLDRYWSSEAVASAIRSGDVDVALLDDAIVGTTEVGELNGDLVMWKLYVLPEHQGSGVGSALLDAVVDRARSERRPLVTEYVASNERAGAFYRSKGFVGSDEGASPTDDVWLRFEG